MLPFDLQREIASYLSLNDLYCVALVNKDYSRLLQDEVIWRRLCQRDFTDERAAFLLCEANRYLIRGTSYRQLYLYLRQTYTVRQRGLQAIRDLYDSIRNDVAEVTEADLEWFNNSEDNEETITIKFYYMQFPILVGVGGRYMGTHKGRKVKSCLTVTLEFQYNWEEERYAYQASAFEYNFTPSRDPEDTTHADHVLVINDPAIVSLPLPRVAQACSLPYRVRGEGSNNCSSGRWVHLTLDTIPLYIETVLKLGYSPIETICNSTYASMPEAAVISNPDYFVTWY